MVLESKEERFKRIATARTLRLLNDIRLLGNCANRGNYAYTDADVKKIFETVQKELKTIKVLFEKSDKHKFSL